MTPAGDLLKDPGGGYRYPGGYPGVIPGGIHGGLPWEGCPGGPPRVSPGGIPQVRWPIMEAFNNQR